MGVVLGFVDVLSSLVRLDTDVLPWGMFELLPGVVDVFVSFGVDGLTNDDETLVEVGTPPMIPRP